MLTNVTVAEPTKSRTVPVKRSARRRLTRRSRPGFGEKRMLSARCPMEASAEPLGGNQRAKYAAAFLSIHRNWVDVPGTRASPAVCSAPPGRTLGTVAPPRRVDGQGCRLLVGLRGSPSAFARTRRYGYTDLCTLHFIVTQRKCLNQK